MSVDDTMLDEFLHEPIEVDQMRLGGPDDERENEDDEDVELEVFNLELCGDEEEESRGQGERDVERNAERLARPVAVGAPDYAASKKPASEVQCICLPRPLAVQNVSLSSSFTIKSLCSPQPLQIQFLKMQAFESFRVKSFQLDEPLPTSIVAQKTEKLERGVYEVYEGDKNAGSEHVQDPKKDGRRRRTGARGKDREAQGATGSCFLTNLAPED